jgi:uncharacterized alpha-E superfamily protein
LADGPVSQVTLLPPANQPLPLSRDGDDLTSRAADDLFWLGRYVERAESLVRLVRGTISRITDQSGVDNTRTVQLLLKAWPLSMPPVSQFEMSADFVEALLGDANGDGLRGLVAVLHGFAKVLRDRISLDSWHILQKISTAILGFRIDPRNPASGFPQLLDNLIERFGAFVGLASDSMTRGQAWTFLQIGRRIERIDFIARFLRNTLVEPETDPSLLEAVLEVMDCTLTYRRRYLTRLETRAVADLLLSDETNPRAVAFQLSQLQQRLTALPRDTSLLERNRDQQILLKLWTSIQLLDFEQLCQPSPEGRRDALDALLGQVIDQDAALSDAIARLYFSHAEISHKLGEIFQEPA